MPHRSYASTANYRFGFNGKENDNEPKGLGNQQDYGNRIYDSRLGKFLSVDPLSTNFPWYTPYQFAGDKPIIAIDLDGLEEYVVTKELYKNGTTKSIVIQYTTKNDVEKSTVDYKFRAIIGKMPDGSNKLGEYLTGKKVIRIIVDANGRASSVPDDNLTKTEAKIVERLSETELPINPSNNFWDLKIGNQKYFSETERDATKMTDKIAAKDFKLINNLNPKINFSNMFLIGTEETVPYNNSRAPNGTYAPYEYSDANKFENLLSEIKEDGGITSANITWNFYLEKSLTASEKKNQVAGIKNALQYIKNRLLAAGVKNVNINVVETTQKANDKGAQVTLHR